MPFVKIDVNKEIDKRLAEDKELRALYEAACREYELKKQLVQRKKNCFPKIRGCQLRHPLSIHLQKLCRRYNFRICDA